MLGLWMVLDHDAAIGVSDDSSVDEHGWWFGVQTGVVPSEHDQFSWPKPITDEEAGDLLGILHTISPKCRSSFPINDLGSKVLVLRGAKCLSLC